MAAYMALHKYGSPHQEPLRDPLLYDTVLSREGLRQVEGLGAAVAALQPQPEAVLVSPLTRCLQTAVAATSGLGRGITVEAEPLLRERVTLSSEVGRAPSELARDFPEVAFPPDMKEVWWYTGGAMDQKAIVKEPQDVYEERLAELRRRLAVRSERCLLVVAHWGVLRALTGRDLQPGEMASVEVVLLPSGSGAPTAGAAVASRR
ncbi:hypothetical protein HYH02_002831 [Chlamydomonas schloesseri]|uniref:Uncharacterized protein n=1 Tax=Chlamydomonas schloesseri TaxID=2026947 RepID=A0A835WR71_9CHLO|nr:hypothetical protein HYH02_002831 [Chlamydomonas schloesseri]|eukprot:KAG2452594.1 hypothetical protein HYH02_002831 [Chlamydomonas schloesseri]